MGNAFFPLLPVEVGDELYILLGTKCNNLSKNNISGTLRI